MKKSFIIPLIILGIVVGVGSAFYMYNKPHRNISKAKVDYSLTADELFSQYETDEKQSDAKYLDKVIEVTGIIETIDEPKENQQTVIIKAASAMMGGVTATFDKDKSGELASYQSGQEITAKCKCTGMLMDVVLIECSVTKK